ncbi:MAG: hypothetical protein O3A84_08735 [Proteobacteria bacterium]|nr:hypothetical protein [Pseudomonadota bacterium]
MAETEEAPKKSELGHAEKLQMDLDTGRALPAAVIPVFALILTLMCLFMAFILFGSGNIFGGAVFSLILVPAGIYVRHEWRRRRNPTGDEEDD